MSEDLRDRRGGIQQMGDAKPGNLVRFSDNARIEDSGIDGKRPAFATLRLTDLPDADPHERGALWNHKGTLKVSAG